MLIENNSEIKTFTGKALITAGILTASVITLFLVYKLHSFFLILFTATLFGIFLQGSASFVHKKTGLNLRAGIFIILAVLLALLSLFFILLGPKIAEQTMELTSRLPEAIATIKNKLNDVDWLAGIVNSLPRPRKIITQGHDILGPVTGIFSSIASFITNVVIVLFIGFYLAYSSGFYVDNFTKLVPKARRDGARDLILSLVHNLRHWLVGRILSMLVVGILTYIGLLIIGLPLALSLSIMAFALAFIPFIGPVIAFIPAVSIGLTISPEKAFYAAAVYSVVQFLESYIITPLIQLRAVSIPPVILISMQILMGILFGFMGLLLSTPFAVVTLVIIQKIYIERVLKNDETFFIDVK